MRHASTRRSARARWESGFFRSGCGVATGRFSIPTSGLSGKRFNPNPNLQKAFAGTLVAKFDQIDDAESEAERDSGQPLLEIYVPVLQPWSGQVVAVSEFYEIATSSSERCYYVRLWAWLAVACATLALFLSAIDDRISRQSHDRRAKARALSTRVQELSDCLLKTSRCAAHPAGLGACRSH